MQENENQNIPLAPLPDLPSEEDARQQRMDEIRPYLLDATRNYPEPYYTLEYKGVPMAPLGGIQAISGQKKNGKTVYQSSQNIQNKSKMLKIKKLMI